MNQIEDFVQVRADGNIVPAGMNVKEMLSLGWGPSKVIALRWHHNGKKVDVAAPHGVHGVVVPGANFIAAIFSEEGSGGNNHLVVLSPDGSVHGRLENRLRHAGLDADGCYCWFEPAIASETDAFGAVFQSPAQGEYRCDINAKLLRVMTVARVR